MYSAAWGKIKAQSLKGGKHNEVFFYFLIGFNCHNILSFL